MRASPRSPEAAVLHENPPFALTFDDVLLVPAASEVLPTQVDTGTALTPRIALSVPLLSSAMDTVTGADLAIALARAGGLGVLHRNLTIESQVAELRRVKDASGDRPLPVAAAIGAGEEHLPRAAALHDAGCDLIVVDTAHGHSRRVIDTVARLRRDHPAMRILAGNVVTAAATDALIEAGADAIKVGVGPGSICTTRLVAGVGVPQITAIAECAAVADGHGVALVADGGIRYPGDIVKAIAAGAHAVMVGSLFAGCDETPGESVEENGRRYRRYRGMGSLGAMIDGSRDRYFQQGVAADKLVAEGVEGRVPCRGPVAAVVQQLIGGLRAGMGYTGCATVEELRRNGRFVRISPAGWRESGAHDVLLADSSWATGRCGEG
ncbi:MAG: IMP dehydrogenase [Deltaproteobacteria bacterium]|nr:IMP dehydrogenase [Deltaproteobacteria bacterium]